MTSIWSWEHCKPASERARETIKILWRCACGFHCAAASHCQSSWPTKPHFASICRRLSAYDYYNIYSINICAYILYICRAFCVAPKSKRQSKAAHVDGGDCAWRRWAGAAAGAGVSQVAQRLGPSTQQHFVFFFSCFFWLEKLCISIYNSIWLMRSWNIKYTSRRVASLWLSILTPGLL